MPAKKSGRGVHRSVADLQVGRKSAFRATPSYADKINFTMTMASEPGMPNSRMFPVFLLWLLYGDVGWGVRKSRNAAVSALGVTKGMAQAFFRAIEGSPFLCRDARIESSTSALRPTVFKFQPFLCGRQLPTGERSATPDHLVERSVETGVEREGARKSKNTDWSELAYWLAIQGDYRQYGSGPGEAYAGAKEDIEIWRQRAGDKALSNAFERAKALNLHGDALIDYLASTRNKYRPG